MYKRLSKLGYHLVKAQLPDSNSYTDLQRAKLSKPRDYKDYRL